MFINDNIYFILSKIKGLLSVKIHNHNLTPLLTAEFENHYFCTPFLKRSFNENNVSKLL